MEVRICDASYKALLSDCRTLCSSTVLYMLNHSVTPLSLGMHCHAVHY